MNAAMRATCAAWEAAASVADPELRVVSIAELGILRDVAVAGDGGVTVTVTPTYTGCPAMDAIRADVRRALHAAGFAEVAVVTVLEPAWSTEDITAAGLAKLAAAGVAPPSGGGRAAAGPVPVRLAVRCPRCGSPETEQLSRFGSTACKALYRCRACAEPFDHFKPL